MATSGSTLHGVADAIARQAGLDRPAELLTTKLRDVLGSGPVKDALSGTWLGHPLHPLLTDLPIGFWTSAFTLDLLGGRHSRRAATRLVAWGVLTAIPTAASGASDWSDTSGPERRVGLVHAAANTTALVCYAASWVERRRGRHWRGVALGLVGATAATVGGFLGGHLLQTLGVGVDRTALRAPPNDWTRVAAAAEIDEPPRCVLAGDAPVIVFRHGGRLRRARRPLPAPGRADGRGHGRGRHPRVPVARESLPPARRRSASRGRR